MTDRTWSIQNSTEIFGRPLYVHVQIGRTPSEHRRQCPQAGGLRERRFNGYGIRHVPANCSTRAALLARPVCQSPLSAVVQAA
jgi:hypothetical protein